MKTIISRRTLLKNSLLTAGGLAIAPSLAEGFAESNNTIDENFLSARESLLWEINPAYESKMNRLKARLLANENPYGPSDRVKKAIADSIFIGNRYGFSESGILTQMIAEKEGVNPEQIMLGPGSTYLLEKTAMVLCKTGGNVVSEDPSFMSLINTAEAVGAKWKPVPLAKDYSLDFDKMEAAVDKNTRLVYLCNPNNPVGSYTSPEKLSDFCKKVSSKVPVFVDEAYLEFIDNYESKSMVTLIKEGKDVIVARTFSKIHGMAGLRIGYIIGTGERIKQIASVVRSSMSLCITSVNAAMASLGDKEFTESSRKLNKEAREFTCEQIKEQGYEYIPSHTSFILFPVRSSGEKFLKSMMDEGVGIRMFMMYNKPHCRVSIGTMEEMKIFSNTLKKVSS
jgi:histidinol-phosphate aminotransferase